MREIDKSGCDGSQFFVNGAAHLPQWSNRLILLMEIIYSLFMTFCFGHEPWKLREIEGQVVIGAKASLEPIPLVGS